MNLYFLDLVSNCKKNEREKVTFVDDEYYAHHRVDYQIGRPKIERDDGNQPKSMIRIRYRHSTFSNKRYLGVYIWEWGACSYQGYETIDLSTDLISDKKDKRIPLMISRIKKGRGKNFVHRSIIEYQRLNT
jgi:hypothetical protein